MSSFDGWDGGEGDKGDGVCDSGFCFGVALGKASEFTDEGFFPYMVLGCVKELFVGWLFSRN